ncbi:FANCI HD2 domain containing protein [Asbolus verrucosus]|uniref:FANCI HD2 domain containing protein n=1 Tax=Asbolus verrucosus TaxID=1661398 RepID=A0A482VIM2_ASBVE|nr:FANCI HD2 domain containing protein [Asbolus verrucosus]
MASIEEKIRAIGQKRDIEALREYIEELGLNEVHYTWKELMPELLNVIIEKECVEHNNQQMTGLDYKHQLINTMCMLQWSPSIVTPLAAMFIDMPLTKEEHLQVVNKLGEYLEKMTPQEIPSFVYQLLRLCKQSNSRRILIVKTLLMLKVRFFTISILQPPWVMNKVFEIVKFCVSRNYHEEQKKTSSAWFRDMVSTTCNIEAVFAQIINLSAQDRDLVLQGLVNFAFTLLGVGSPLGRDLVAEKQWHLGSMILFKIIKRKRHTAPVVIEQLSNRIISGHTVTQYIECIYMLSKNLTLLMLENKSTVVLLMESLVQMPGNNAKQLLDAIIPLTKVSPTIRDHFILLLRKALYSRNTETRQVAVIGFLKLLTNLKISNLAAVSQSSFSGSYSSGHSLFTQISINQASQCMPSAFSNEALCLEILSILRRCFMQQAEVRIQLYEGLYDAVCLNPELGIPVLEMIWLHFSDFYNIDDEVLPPLKFDKIVITKDVNVTLQEPLGKLIYTIGLIVTKVIKIDNENTTVIKFNKILESLCSRMINCELVNFDLDDGTDLLDVMPESQEKLLILKEAMCVYEALIGYKFYSWELESENNDKEVSGLFQGYFRLLNFSKNISKPKKAESKKKKDCNKTTEQTNNTTLKKDGQRASKSFKPPDTALDFQTSCALDHTPASECYQKKKRFSPTHDASYTQFAHFNKK